MPRTARIHAPGSLVHVISRFVDHEYRITNDEIRLAYLDRLGRYIARTDWILLGYGVMSNHVHHSAIAGEEHLDRWMLPLDSWMAGFLNRLQGRHGPVFQERPTTLYMPLERAVRLIPYIHNNPHRAGLPDERYSPAWTSHLAYIGMVEPIPGLDVERGLCLCGFGTDPLSLRAFDALVQERAHETRDPLLSGLDVAQQRAMARNAAGAPVEIISGEATEDDITYALVPASLPVRQLGIQVEPQDVLAVVSTLTDVSIAAIVSRDRRRCVCRARRLAVRVWQMLGRPMTELCRPMGISSPAASYLLYRQSQEDLEPLVTSAVEALVGSEVEESRKS